MSQPSRPRWWLVGVVLGLTAALVVTLAVVMPPNRLAGSALAMDPATAGADALDQLAELDDIRLTGWVRTETAQRLRVDIVSLEDGTQAVVHDEAGGVAEFLVRKDEAAIKANAAWWLNTVPAYAQEHTDTWVTADDDMGFPVGALSDLSGDRIQKLISDRSADERWNATPTVFHDGKPAIALSAGESGWTVFVSPTEPPRLLGFGGPLLAEVDRVTGGQPEGRGYPGVELATAVPDKPCRDRADRKARETAPKFGDLPQPEVPAVAERPQLQASVSAGGGICMTPLCPFTVMVVNVGSAPGVGSVLITSSSGPPLSAPLNLPPGGQFTTAYNAPNPAPPSPGGRVTVPIYVQAFAQVTSLAGPDVNAGKRLHDRGIDPNNPIAGQPAAVGPAVTNILDRLTTNAPVAGFGRQDDVVEAATDLLGEALDAGLATLLQQLVNSPALRYGNDTARTPLLDLFEKAAKGTAREKDVALRTLKLLAALTNGRPAPATPDTAPVYVKDGVVIDDTTKHTYVVGHLKGGLKGQQGNDALYDELERAADQLNNDGVVPPGYAKVVEVTIKGSDAGTLGTQNRSQLRDLLREGESNGKSFRDLLLDGDGKLVINGLSIISNTSALPNRGAVGGAFVFDSADMLALGQSKSDNPPAVPPASITPHFTPYTRKHTLEGDASDTTGRQGGGHRHGTGAPDKTEYPEPWSDPQIDQRAVEVANRAIQNKHPGNNQYDGDSTSANGTTIGPPLDNKNQMGVEVTSWVIHGTVNGVELEITLLEDGTIFSSYPTGRVADPSGTLQPYDARKAEGNPNLPYRNPKLPAGKPKAELPQPGKTPPRTKEYSVLQTQRPQYRRVGADGKPEWAHRGEARPGGPGKPAVPVEVTRDKDGNRKKTTKTSEPKPAEPAPAVCRTS